MNLTFLNKLVFRSPALAYMKKDHLDLNAIKEAIYLASPILTQELVNLEKGLVQENRQKQKLKESVYKYHSRSCTRSTPFGLFAGIGTCKWGNESRVELSENRRRETRLDMNYVCALGQYITSIKEVRDCLLFFPNDSIYSVSDKVRYVDYKYINTKRSHQISEVDNSEYLDKILKTAANGARLKELALVIVDDGVDENEAYEFILEVVNAQLLKSELEANVTGEHYFDILLKSLIELKKSTLQENDQIGSIIHSLTQINDRIKRLDEEFSNSIDTYKEIVALVKELPVSFDENNLFQTDLYLKTTAASVGLNVQQELIYALKFLTNLNSIPRETAMTKFIEEYYKRYENEELPLLLVLDTEIGIGYARNKGGNHNPLIDNIPFYQLQREAPNKNGFSLNYSELSLMLREKLNEAYKNGQYSVKFTDEDLSEIKYIDKSHISASFYIGFSLPSPDKIILNFAGGECGAKMLGRFAGGDPEILETCREIIDHENKFFEGKILAEIAHLPESRTGNILMRPAFREYEIPYLAKPSVAKDKVIPLSDLYVSIRNGRELVLRSKKLNKEILPRLTNMHNFIFNALPVYQFLCDAQSYNRKNFLSFDWGSFARGYKFKPRAVYGNVILREASWDLRKKDIETLVNKGFDKENISQFLLKWSMPEAVLLTDADNTLLVEWFNELSFRTFLNSVKTRDFFTLTEHVFGDSIVKDKDGQCYENEFLAFVKNDIPDVQISSDRADDSAHSQRIFPVGSEWIFYKFYAGFKTSDVILSEYLLPVITTLLEEKVIDKWFFIRYGDPDNHLRVRLHIQKNEYYGKVVAKIGESVNPLLDDKLIWKIQMDTYNREIDRYGKSSMELCEQYFFHDSTFIVNVVSSIEGEDGDKVRWITGFRSVDQLLNDFGFLVNDKLKLMESLAYAFRKENGDSKSLRIVLDTKFRELRKDIELHLNHDKDAASELRLIWDFLSLRTQQTNKIVSAINKLKEADMLSVNYYDLISSLIHMSLNRLFKSQQRSHELVIYDLLYHYYKSMIARESKAHKVDRQPLSELIK